MGTCFDASSCRVRQHPNQTPSGVRKKLQIRGSTVVARCPVRLRSCGPSSIGGLVTGQSADRTSPRALGSSTQCSSSTSSTTNSPTTNTTICHLLFHHPDVIACGACWTDAGSQRPVGDTGRHELAHPDAIIDAELERALTDPDPIRGMAQLAARWGAAFVLDPAGVTRTKALGSERMARKVSDALPGGDGAVRGRVGVHAADPLAGTCRAHRYAFVIDQSVETTVDLEGQRAASGLDELALGDDEPDAEA
jgi:hypothetical protein